MGYFLWLGLTLTQIVYSRTKFSRERHVKVAELQRFDIEKLQ